MEVPGTTADAISTFTKKGVCIKHKIKGDVLHQKTRAWKKKKFGYDLVTTTVISHK